ncbi:MAG: hypothetical protein ACTS8H_02290 [Arsenophonus sp. NC-PE1-MAG3]
MSKLSKDTTGKVLEKCTSLKRREVFGSINTFGRYFKPPPVSVIKTITLQKARNSRVLLLQALYSTIPIAENDTGKDH